MFYFLAMLERDIGVGAMSVFLTQKLEWWCARRWKKLICLLVSI